MVAAEGQLAVRGVVDPPDPAWNRSSIDISSDGLLLAVLAGWAVTWLGSCEAWPSWKAAGEILSSARHTLWSDALSPGPRNLSSGQDLERLPPRPTLCRTHRVLRQCTRGDSR